MGIFDYSIPPALLPDIKIGLLVLVPFAGRKVEGIIIDIKKSSAIENLKPILSVIDTVPVIDKVHTELAKWMADYYLTGFSKTLFENIVPPAKRTIKKQEELKSKTSDTITKGQNRRYLVMADFNSRLKFYLRAIKKTISEHRQVIILVPDLSLAPLFTKFIKNHVSIIHSGLTVTERWLEWNEIRRGEIDVVIGSNSALFVPTPNLGLIIIDQEENETYKNDQSPRFHASHVAEKLSQLTGADLVLGSVVPSLESYTKARKNNYLFGQNDHGQKDISIINMNFEHSIVSLALKEKISLNLAEHKKTLLFLNRKEVGMTTAKLEKIVSGLYPAARIMRIEKGKVNDPTKTDWDIAIATSFALKIALPTIVTIGIMDADQDQNLPGYRTQEKNFQTLYKLLKIGSNVIIQTHLPEKSFISNLAQTNYDRFAQEELSLREKFQYPPFINMILLRYRHPDTKITEIEAQKVFDKLNDIKQKNSLDLNLLGPVFSFCERQFYYYQIIIKLKKRTAILDEFLKNLPKGWTIDIDPYDIS